MKGLKLFAAFSALMCLQVEANVTVVDITGSSPQAVKNEYEATFEVQRGMEESGFNLHYCNIVPRIYVQQDLDGIHSQAQCFYSQPGERPTEDSEIAQWYLDISYDPETQLFKAESEYTNNYHTRVYTLEPNHLLEVGPHYISKRNELQSLGMSVGECNIQQIYYSSMPTENTYLSHMAICNVSQAGESLVGQLIVEIDFTKDQQTYSERYIEFTRK
ncbi:hypothetical protein BS333_19745 [Vibrio azureus]|uniref:Uncharacterized protein n=1 Tax=Vibrio azureus NBRC 104587 TaxID=1219077 RepID=U3ATD0_9VIBR|nr:hypothetical protein [Vibrio azureus]AUI88545.1 hypothetical protein BS333_19745 [Vibrio azureus]GAD77020.1 hypothetical protein VAZ01S_058_00100 [Vibrio azureus NBRC 104587]